MWNLFIFINPKAQKEHAPLFWHRKKHKNICAREMVIAVLFLELLQDLFSPAKNFFIMKPDKLGKKGIRNFNFNFRSVHHLISMRSFYKFEKRLYFIGNFN